MKVEDSGEQANTYWLLIKENSSQRLDWTSFLFVNGIELISNFIFRMQTNSSNITKAGESHAPQLPPTQMGDTSFKAAFSQTAGFPRHELCKSSAAKKKGNRQNTLGEGEDSKADLPDDSATALCYAGGAAGIAVACGCYRRGDSAEG